MSYRLNHIFGPGDCEAVAKKSLEIAKELREAKLPRDRIHLWFKKRFNIPTKHFKMKDDQIAVLVPFLAREKKSNYIVVEKDAAEVTAAA